jgi:hypothetical protein
MINTFLDILFVIIVIIALVVGIMHLCPGDYQDRDDEEK